MRKAFLVLLTLLILCTVKNVYADGPQIFVGYQTGEVQQSAALGFQYSWTKSPDDKWRFLSPGLITHNDDGNWSLSLQLISRRLFKFSSIKYRNPPALYLGFYVTHKDRKGLSLSLGW